MQTVQQTPTRPRHYALISGAFGAGVLGTSVVARRTGRTVPGLELLPLGLATFTFSRVLTQQKVAAWMREPFVDEPEEGTSAPRDRGLRYAVGELLSCTRCTGSWVALGLVATRVLAPDVGRVLTAVGTLGAVDDVALAAFSLLTADANTADARERREEAETAARLDGVTPTATHA